MTAELLVVRVGARPVALPCAQIVRVVGRDELTGAVPTLAAGLGLVGAALPPTRAIVLDGDRAFAIDAIVEVATVAAEHLLPLPAPFTRGNGRFSALALLADGPVLVVDVARLPAAQES